MKYKPHRNTNTLNMIMSLLNTCTHLLSRWGHGSATVKGKELHFSITWSRITFTWLLPIQAVRNCWLKDRCGRHGLWLKRHLTRHGVKVLLGFLSLIFWLELSLYFTWSTQWRVTFKMDWVELWLESKGRIQKIKLLYGLSAFWLFPSSVPCVMASIFSPFAKSSKCWN